MPSNLINPNCHACSGTGTDQAFGGACSECARWGTTRITDPREVTYAQGEAMQRGYSRNGGGAAGQPVPMATDKQVAFVHRLLAQTERTPKSAEQGQAWARIDAAADHPMTRRAASDFIDMLQAMAPTAAPARTNAHPGKCTRCGQTVAAGAGSLTKGDRGWIVAHLGECPAPAAQVATIEDGIPGTDGTPPLTVDGIDLRPLERFTSAGLCRFAVPGGDTRLKLRVKFANNGTIYVDDAAEYGQGSNYGSQREGQAYRGKVQAELRAILADPAAAIIAYTELVGRCGVCNRHLEAGESVERGIGPVCWGKIAG